MVEPVPEEVMLSITGSAGSQMNGAMLPWARRGAISPVTSSVSMQYVPPPRFLDLPHSLITEESQNILVMASGQSMLIGESQMVMVRNSVDSVQCHHSVHCKVLGLRADVILQVLTV